MAPSVETPERGTVGRSVPTTESLAAGYDTVRRFSEELCVPLQVEDYVVQSMADVSPTRWHLAHTTWFFETFLLSNALPRYRAFHPDFNYLFNSYYNTVGAQFPRARRGLLSRPTVREVYDYRAYVDRHMRHLLESLDFERKPELGVALETGIHHEQQHQELLLTDIKHVFSCNPMRPAYAPEPDGCPAEAAPPLRWVPCQSGVYWIGEGGAGFSYDNEQPRHQAFVEAFEMASRLVTNVEYMAFMADGGYTRPELWLSEGWALVQEEGWLAPLYWEERDGERSQFTLSGMRPVRAAEPVCHVSYFEADAYARWSGAWLPYETAWEVAAARAAIEGNFVEEGRFHPKPAPTSASEADLLQLYGDVWEWTCSPYAPYPRYRPSQGALGEYNGKFMCNQMVLRGGSCATSRTHIRPTYRNFFPPSARWQLTGIRLVR